MEWDDDDFIAGHDEMAHAGHRSSAILDGVSAGGLYPMDISDPASAYFLLSDDAQDEITGTGKTKMKCRACGHRFMGKIYDRCPECFSSDIDEGADETKNRYW